MWNMGDLLDAVAAVVQPTAPAFIHGERMILWPEAKQRMDALAYAMRQAGLETDDRIGFYLRNSPAYGEMAGACFLGGFAHVNVNYRYTADEVLYILDNADAAAIVYDAEFRPIIDLIRPRLTSLKLLIEVGEGASPSFAKSYEALATTPAGVRDWARGPGNLMLIYTGGTTGMPKGVMYTHNDLAPYLLASSTLFGTIQPTGIDDVLAMIAARGGAGSRYMPACPQMHGTGLFVTLWTMLTGGCVVTLEGVSLDADALWRAVERWRITNIAIVGDAFARPLLLALDAADGAYDLSSLEGIGSSGAMWSAPCKEGLIRHLPGTLMIDVFASTETNGMGLSISGGGAKTTATATFVGGTAALVIDDDDRPLPPGCGQPGRLAVGGMQPIGYWKDAEKTARTFRTIDGQRYSIPGDYALIAEDGTVTLLGRGSHCINTAGEKVYPEEVEEALKSHPDVEDALVIGVPDEVWGQVVTGVVRLVPGVVFDEAALKQSVRNRLAGYKTPKRILVTGLGLRLPNGKADYGAAAAALEQARPSAAA